MEQAEAVPEQPNNEHPTVLQNETPGSISNGFYIGLAFIQTYGWFVVLGVAILFYLKNKLQPHVENWQRKREERQEYENYDSDEALRKQESLEAARQRLQAQYDEQAAGFAERQKEKEEQRRQDKVAEWEKHQSGLGYHSKYRPKEEEDAENARKAKKPVSKYTYRQNDYSPLGGGGGGASFRPSGRSGGGARGGG